jgi:hypothetical protein
MKKMLSGGMIVLLVFFLSVGLGLAGNGKGSNGGNGGGSGAGDGTDPIHDIYAGEPFTYEGDVIECQGDGIVIAVAGENITIYGIGPVRYWDSLELVKPAVGDTVTVTGYTVDYNGELRNIAVTINVGGVEVPLRDADTGTPLWRQGGQK